MKCPKCGREIPDDSQSCVNCGVTFRRIPKAATTPSSGAHTQQSPPPENADNRTIAPPPQHNDTPDALPNDIVSHENESGNTPSGEEDMLREKLAGRYEIIKKLGAGGMASVYLAREIALNREVAIKLLPGAFVRDSAFVARFKNEARVAANLEHPNIVRIYQIAEEGELVYFVMSYIPGGSVTDRIASGGPLPVGQVVKWGMEVCSALAYGHKKGVIHRDLKPDNIMLDRNDTAIVMDYGIARAGEGTGLTQTGSVIGTPQYMSPEQARGKELDARSDIYSIGIVLYQMATGELPFQAADAASLMYMHVHEHPEPPDARNADVPQWLRNIILKCLAKNPEDRFTGVEELSAALAAHHSPKVTETPIRERKTSKIWYLAGVALILIIAGLAAFGYWQAGRKQAAEEASQLEEQAARTVREQEQEAQLANRDNRAWEQALSVNSRESITAYLLVYPDGLHADEANETLALLESAEEESRAPEPAAPEETAAEREARETAAMEERRRALEAEAARQDDLAFQNAEMVDTEQAYTTYLRNYPEGRHVGDANERLTAITDAAAEASRIAEEAAAARDDEAYRVAGSEDTRQSYNAYLIAFPNGRHNEEANARIAEIDRQEEEAEKVRLALVSLTIRMVKVPAGSFVMGSSDGDDDEKPAKQVTLDGFAMSATEITQGQYREIIGDNPSYARLDDNNPVERVSWLDAAMFCNKLSERVGLEPCYTLPSGVCDYLKNGFRLPTEAEWEYACRAESGSGYSLGEGESALDRAGWYRRNSQDHTHPVGQKTPNAWGLSDMHGNVWEWCGDWYAKNAYSSDNAQNPHGPASGNERVVRGGSYLDGPDDARSAKRRSYDPEKSYSDIGFRIVRGQ